MDLSIVIVNYNTKELTRNCIDSLIKNTQNVSYEIILVDNASEDGSCKYLTELFLNLKIIINTNNLGFAKANNQGIRIASGRYVLLLNSDTIVFDDCLKKVLEYAETKPDVGVIGCKVLNRDRTLQYTCYHHPSFLSELIFFTKGIIKNFWDPVTWRKYMGYWNHNSIKDVDCISGCFLMLKKELVDLIGYIDENFFMYYEDSDFCRRVKKNGFRVLYYPHAYIVHLQGISGDRINFTTIKQCFDSACYYIMKYNGKFISGIFRILCLSIFKIEKLIFSFLKVNNKCSQKEKMLKTVIG